eukprot:scaffold57807_cov39-Phaeocystis_antarctica.AAC.1
MARAPAQRRTTRTALSAPKAMAIPDESATSLPGSSKVRLRAAAAEVAATVAVVKVVVVVVVVV